MKTPKTPDERLMDYMKAAGADVMDVLEQHAEEFYGPDGPFPLPYPFVLAQPLLRLLGLLASQLEEHLAYLDHVEHKVLTELRQFPGTDVPGRMRARLSFLILRLTLLLPADGEQEEVRH